MWISYPLDRVGVGHLHMFLKFFYPSYHPPMKSLESNVFSRVYVCVCMFQTCHPLTYSLGEVAGWSIPREIFGKISFLV